MKQTRFAAFLFALVAAVAQVPDGPKHAANGALLRPTTYREWVFLSSGLGMTYVKDKPKTPPAFDNAFVTPSAYKHFVETGTWQEGTYFVTELRKSETKGSINTAGYFQTDVVMLEVHTKEKGQWTFYQFPNGATEAQPLPRTQDCYSCHAAHGAVDDTFVQFYPTLIPIAKAHGTYKPKD